MEMLADIALAGQRARAAVKGTRPRLYKPDRRACSKRPKPMSGRRSKDARERLDDLLSEGD